VSAGSHIVEFSYRPVWFYVGVIFSFSAWVGVVGYFIWLRRI
jgi:hypothetical protein